MTNMNHLYKPLRIRIAKGDILVFMDGDNQHNPEDIKNLLTYLSDYDSET